MNFYSATLVVVLAVSLGACETMAPASYSNYADNTFALRKLEGVKVRLGQIDDQSKFESGCRLVGPIKTAGNRPIAEFVRDSINDEFKFAGLYSDDPATTVLKAKLTAASFSSMGAFTQGHWNFSLELSNPTNGKSLSTNATYNFDSGFNAAIACINVSNALTPAVQRLINSAVTDPQFATLVR